MGGELTDSKFDLMTFRSDTILNYQLSQKLKLIGRSKFNHLTITLTKQKYKKGNQQYRKKKKEGKTHYADNGSQKKADRMHARNRCGR
jgi:hypothetical protein